MGALSDRVEPFVLHCDSRRMSLFEYAGGKKYVEREQHKLRTPLRAFPHRSEEYDAVVRGWLIRYNFEFVHVRHIGWHSLGLIDEAARLSVPVGFSFHDFYAVCPTVKLLDETMQHCAGQCTPGNGKCTMDLWSTDDYPSLKNEAVHLWRRQLAQALEKCSIFFTTSEGAKAQLISTFPFLEKRSFEVIPHGRDFKRFEQIGLPLQKGEKLRILIPGNISPAKGGHIVSALASKAERLGIEIHILGKVAKSVDTSKGIVLHGSYDREDFLDKARAIKPHVGGIFSLWPETYCHTLTELWASGLPVLALDFGAVGERIRETGAGWLIKHKNDEETIRQLEKLTQPLGDFKKRLAAVHQWQKNEGKLHSSRHMADRYMKFYQKISPALSINAKDKRASKNAN